MKCQWPCVDTQQNRNFRPHTELCWTDGWLKTTESWFRPSRNQQLGAARGSRERLPSFLTCTRTGSWHLCGTCVREKRTSLGAERTRRTLPLANQERAPTWGLWGDRDSLEHPHLNVTVLDARESGVRSKSTCRGGRRKWKGRGQGTRCWGGWMLGTPGEGGLLLGASLPLFPSIPFALHPTLPFSHHLTVWQDLPIRAPASGQHRPIPGSKPGPHYA